MRGRNVTAAATRPPILSLFVWVMVFSQEGKQRWIEKAASRSEYLWALQRFSQRRNVEVLKKSLLQKYAWPPWSHQPIVLHFQLHIYIYIEGVCTHGFCTRAFINYDCMTTNYSRKHILRWGCSFLNPRLPRRTVCRLPVALMENVMP